MRYRDEFRIASTAVLLSISMVVISAVVPKESRVPTAKTTLTEAPTTAAEAEAEAQQAEFPIYTQESNYDTSSDYSQDDIYYEDSSDGSGGDTSGTYTDPGTDSSPPATRLPILLKIPEIIPEMLLEILLVMFLLIFQIIPKILPRIMAQMTMKPGMILRKTTRAVRKTPPGRIFSIMNKT